MNNRLKLSTGLLLGVALLLSVLNSAPFVAAQPAPNTMIHTGDHFTFSEVSTNIQNNTRFFTMYNKTNPSQLMHGDDELSYDYTYATGQSDVGFVRQDANLPTLAPMDTWVSIKSDLTSQLGSYHIDYQNSTNGPTWSNVGNNTYPTDGQHQGNDQSIGMSSNATYAVIFPEMTQTQLNITDQMGGDNPFQNFAGFNGLISRTQYQETTGTRNFNINGNSWTLNIKTISIVFYGFWSQSGWQYVPFGPQGDPNTPTANVSTYNTLEFMYSLNYTYDTGNTLLLENSQDSSVVVHMTFPSQNVTLSSPNQGDLFNATIQQDAVGMYSDDHVSTVSSTDSFYGNNRPTSTADVLRLHDGDFLKYNWDQGSNSNLDWSYKVQNSTGIFNSQDVSKYTSDETKGDLTIDVFRHNANMFDAVLALQGTGDYSYYRSGSRSDNQGTYYDQNQDYQQHVPNALYFGLIQLGSDSSHDVTPFFENQMNLDFKILDCNNGNGDCLNLNFQRDVAKSGNVNITDYYINLVQEQPGDYPVINGNTYYEFNVTEQTQLYSMTYSGYTDIPVFYGPNQLSVNVPITVQADAKQSFYYDRDTGALVAQDQEVHGSITINYSGSQTLQTDQGYSYLVDVNINVNAHSDSYQSMLLNTHPYFYNTQPTMPTVSTPPSSSSSSTTTTSSEPQSSESTGGAGLPLPTPVLPIVFGLFSMVVIVRKRK